jgi:hypothetical protein
MIKKIDYTCNNVEVHIEIDFISKDLECPACKQVLKKCKQYKKSKEEK